MAIDDKRQSKYELEAEDTIAVLASLKDTSKRLDDTMKLGEKLLKDSSSIINNAVGNIQDVMTFSSKSLSDTFKVGNILEKSREKEFLNYMKIEAQLDTDRKNLSKSIEEIDDAILAMKLAAENAGEVVDQSKLNNLEQLKNIEKQKLRQINSTNAVQMHQINCQKALFDRVVKLATGAIDTIIGVYTQAFSSAYNKVSSTWESTFGDVTSMNNYSKAEYTKIIDSMTKYLKDTGLDKSISLTNYQNEIVDILKGGLTGDLANTVAKYSVISKEGGISANFSDESFLKLVKDIEDSGGNVEQFLQNVTAQSKAVIDEVGDSFGFANGQINTMMNSLYELSAVTDMTDKALKNSTTSMTALTGVLGKTKFDANKVFSNITDYVTKGLEDNSAQNLLSFMGMDASAATNLVETEGTGALIEKMMSKLYDDYGNNSREFMSALNKAVGSNYTVEEVESLLSTYTKDEFFDKYDKAYKAASGADYKAYEKNLGKFQTEQEKLANSAETEVAELVKIAKSNVIVEGLVDKGVGLLTSINTQMLYNTGKGLFSDLKGAFGKGGKPSSLFSKGKGSFIGPQTYSGQSLGNIGGAPTQTGALSKVGSLFNNGTAFASKGGTLAKVGSKVFSTGGKALGVAGSLISMGIDGYQGYKEDGWAGAARGAITGSGKISENGWDVAKGTGSAALKGAGIGMAAGPWGMAIGAVVGGLTGLAVGLNDLTDVNKQAKLTIDKVDKSYSKLRETVEKYNTANEKIVSAEQDYAKLVYENGELVEGAKPSKELLKAYPELNTYLDENGAVTEQYTSLLKQLIEAEKKQNAAKLLDVNFDELKKTNSRQMKDTFKSVSSAQAGANFANLFTNPDNNVTGMSVNNDRVTATYTDSNGKSHSMTVSISDLDAAGVSYTDLAQYAKNSGGLDSYTLTTTDNETGKDTTTTINTKVDTSKIGDVTKRVSGAQSKADTQYNEAYQTAFKYAEKFYLPVSAMMKSFDWKFGDNGDKTDDQWTEFQEAAGDRWDTTIKNVMETFNTGLTELLKYDFSKGALELDGVTFKSADDIKSRYADVAPSKLKAWQNAAENSNAWFSGGDLDYTPAFAVGLDYVPYDNFYARLHKGERVQTAAEANLDRASSKVNSSSMAESLKSSLVYQTDIIIDILRKIYISVSGSSATSISSNMNISLPSNAT